MPPVDAWRPKGAAGIFGIGCKQILYAGGERR
jgi:hypothetical protein